MTNYKTSSNGDKASLWGTRVSRQKNSFMTDRRDCLRTHQRGGRYGRKSWRYQKRRERKKNTGRI